MLCGWCRDCRPAGPVVTGPPMPPVAEETTALDVSEGDTFYAVSTYVAESEETMHLVEGERVYILGERCRITWPKTADGSHGYKKYVGPVMCI